VTRTYRLFVLVALCSAALAACQSRSPAEITAQGPDEFLVVGRSPLIVPPDYALRPPSPGEPRPQDLNPEGTARAALVGGRAAASASSEGERLLMVKAGANEADPRIKEVIDDEQGDLAHKSKSFADMVLFWRKDQPTTAAAPTPGAGTATPIDPEAEARRLAGLTGGKPVRIVAAPPPAEKRRFKLPGL
jgi:hypothetical protein